MWNGFGHQLLYFTALEADSQPGVTKIEHDLSPNLTKLNWNLIELTCHVHTGTTESVIPARAMLTLACPDGKDKTRQKIDGDWTLPQVIKSFVTAGIDVNHANAMCTEFATQSTTKFR